MIFVKDFFSFLKNSNSPTVRLFDDVLSCSPTVDDGYCSRQTQL